MILSTNLDEYVDDCKIALGVVVDLRFDCKGQCFVVQPLPLFHDKEIKSKSWSFIWKMTTHLRHRLFLQWLRKSGKSSRVAQRFGKSAVKGTLCKLSKNHICAILRFLDIQNLTKTYIHLRIVHMLQPFYLFFSASIWKQLFPQDAELLPIL